MPWEQILIVVIVLTVLTLFLVGARILLRLICNELAKSDTLFTYRQEGKFKFLLEGERLLRIIYKLEGKKLVEKVVSTPVTLHDGSTVVKKEKIWKVITDRHNTSSRLSVSEWIFGVQWIGLPPRKIKVYELMWKRPLRPGDEVAAQDPKTRNHYVVDKEHDMVTRMDKTTWHQYRWIYSIFIEGIEVKGVKITDPTNTNNSIEGTVQINLWGTFTLETVNPYKPVMLLDGQWFHTLEDGLQGIISDYFSKMDLDEIREKSKASSAANANMSSELEQRIIAFNDAPGGTIENTGLKVVAFNYGGYEIVDSDVIGAAKSRAVAAMKAGAVIAEAEGQAQAIERLAKAEKERLVSVRAGLGGDSLTAMVEREKEEAKGVAGFKGDNLTKLSGGTNLPIPTFNVNQPAPTQQPVSTQTQTPATTQTTSPTPTPPPNPTNPPV